MKVAKMTWSVDSATPVIALAVAVGAAAILPVRTLMCNSPVASAHSSRLKFLILLHPFMMHRIRLLCEALRREKMVGGSRFLAQMAWRRCRNRNEYECMERQRER